MAPRPRGGDRLPRATELARVLALLEARVREAVSVRRFVDPEPDDAFRGLYVSDADVDRLLAGGWPPLVEQGAEPLAAQALQGPGRGDEALGLEGGSLLDLADRFQLTSVDLDLLLVALAPEIDGRFERLYGYLNDDVTKRRATIALALGLCGLRLDDARGRGRLGPSAPLVAGGLVVVEDGERPFPTRTVRVPDRVVGHLLGDESPAHELTALLVASTPPPPFDRDALERGALVRALSSGARVVYLKERAGSAGRSAAIAALADVGLEALSIDLGRIPAESDVVELARLAGREARLTGAGLVVGPLEALGELSGARSSLLVRAFAELPVVVVMLGRSGFDPEWCSSVPAVLEPEMADSVTRRRMWVAVLGDLFDGDEVAAADAADAVAAYRLGPEQVARAAEASRIHAAAHGVAFGKESLRAGARAQNAAGLERLARRVEPTVGFDDLVLPAPTRRQLEELVARMRYRDVVLGEWGMRPGGGRGHGVTALFAGDSGTGKTMSAEVVAGSLGLELYTINLATVVDKYIGETEKNLERIFNEVDRVNGVLLFDEADALFGKRSEVNDAHDRYANIEVAYLLQRIESFDGLALLATNLRASVDEAFTRRLDSVIEFPFPDAEQRLALWTKSLDPLQPFGDDVDLSFLAKAFELSGGNIASVALTAAYLAASAAHNVTMADLVRAVHREYRKLGRLSVPAEFGTWFHVVER